MKVIVEVVSGALAGKKIVVESGRTIRVGRESRAELSFPGDRMMSREHLLIGRSEFGCWIRDLNSSNGTLVNGMETCHADLNNGDQIVAGETRFSISFDPEEPAITGQSRDTGGSRPSLLTLLRGVLQPLYALLDTAVEPDVLKLLYESNQDRASLYEGLEARQLVHFAPQLVRVPAQSQLLQTLVEQAWGKHWGVFITCDASLTELLTHLRQFLTARLPDGREMHFRYYDPRILRTFLPTCLPSEGDKIFGRVKYFITEHEDPAILLRFSNTDHGIERQALPLATH